LDEMDGYVRIEQPMRNTVDKYLKWINGILNWL